MPTSEEFRLELFRMFYEGVKQAKSTLEISAGELHRRVGDYPGADHRMPVCCEVMRSQLCADDLIIEEPPSGQGASLTIRYTLPRLEPEP